MPRLLSPRWLLACSAVICLAVWSGCQKPQPEPGASGQSAKDAAGKPSPSTTGEGAASAAQPLTARQVLEKMAAAYKSAATYTDKGTVRVVADTDKGPIDVTSDFAVTLARPNQARLLLYQGVVSCDGQTWHAVVQSLAGQVVERPAPAQVTLKSVYADRVLAGALTHELIGPSPILLLLLGDQPLKTLLEEVKETALGEPGKVEDRDCYCVKLQLPDDMAVFWIDRENFVVRRITFPTGVARQRLEHDRKINSISLVADLREARLGGPADPAAFRFEVPQGAKLVRFLLPPDPGQLLGQKCPDFKFIDLQGKPVTPATLAGKVVLLDFWATWCEPCRVSLPNLEKIREKYQDKIEVLAVSVDAPEVENKAVEETIKQLGVSVPVVRDPEQHAGKLLRIMPIPTMVLIGANGIVQDRDVGIDPALAEALPQKLDKLLAGQDIYEKPRAKVKEEEKLLEDAAEGRLPDEPPATEAKIPIPQAQVAPPTQPKTLKLTSLWKCSEVQKPGNILVVPQADGSTRLAVLDSWLSVAEVAADGKLLATHKLDLEQGEAVCNLRTFVGRDGKRVFVGFAPGQQRLHLLDENWKLLRHYPDDALKNPHKGMADVALGDLDGDGTAKAYIGYWDVVGVHAVMPDGTLHWKARHSFNTVLSLAIGAADAQGRRNLLCTHSGGSITLLDHEGQRKGEVNVTGRMVALVAAADLLGDGQAQYCGLAPRKMGDNLFVGLNLKGDELWNYALPEGALGQPIERIISGKVTATRPGQWLLPGPDGSIHILMADGKPLDQFNYGAALCGLATIEADGKPVLVVASNKGLEAWRVE